MTVEEIIQIALEGDAIAFLGAGFSVGAKNFDQNEKFLIGNDLCNKLIKNGKIDVHDETTQDIEDLQYIASKYLESNTKRDLIGLLKTLYTCKEVADHHITIADIPWKKIYTTNYDDVMEVASKRTSRNRNAVETKNKISDIYGTKDAIIHINGYINTVDEDDLDDFFKLTTKSYYTETLTYSDWAIALHTDIKNARAVVFIGYSLDYDLELQKIFACDNTLKDKCIFVDKNPTKRKRLRMEPFGMIYDQGVEKFSDLVKEIQMNFNVSQKKYM